MSGKLRAVAAVVLLATAGCGTNTAAGPPAPSGSAPPPSSPPPSTAPASTAPPSSAAPVPPDPKVARILAGKRKVVVHVATAGQDLSATYEGPITTGDGTDDGALFRILPASKGRHLVEALRAREEGGRWCAAVQTENDLATLTTVECEEAAETLFTIEPTGATDDRKRPTHRLVNAKYGTLRWSDGDKGLHLDPAGGSPAALSFVDRGKA